MRWCSQAVIILGHSHESFENDLDELLTLLCRERHLLSHYLHIYFCFTFSQGADCILPSLMKTSMYKMPVREDFLSSGVPGEVCLVFLGC